MLKCLPIRVFLAAITAGLLIFSPFSLAQQCNRRGVVSSGADVYENPPRYLTGVGWQGSQKGYLSSGTQVYICGEQSVQFGFSEKIWSQIAYLVGNRWDYGWILKDKVRDLLAMDGRPGKSVATLIAVAYAVASPPSNTPPPQWKLPQNPPDSPSRSEKQATYSGRSVAPSPWADLINLYGPFFIAILLGMIVKVLVDYLEAWDKAVLYAHLRNGVIAILVSPIVFLGFLNGGQFPTEQKTFIALCLMAFQNGFFWQTVLKK
ncbi:MAG: hypothetical protein ABSB32_11635 [Thermodesulfobacteriota bacterium]|jgi:hypothetical protein